MGFDVYDARVRRGGGRSRYRRCFQIKRSLYGSPRRVVALQPHPLASVANRSTRRRRNFGTREITGEIIAKRVPIVVISQRYCCTHNRSLQSLKIYNHILSYSIQEDISFIKQFKNSCKLWKKYINNTYK